MIYQKDLAIYITRTQEPGQRFPFQEVWPITLRLAAFHLLNVQIQRLEDCYQPQVIYLTIQQLANLVLHKEQTHKLEA